MSTENGLVALMVIPVFVSIVGIGLLKLLTSFRQIVEGWFGNE